MKFRFTIRRKLLALVAVIILVYTLAIGMVLVRFETKLTKDSEQIAVSFLKQNASSVRTIFNQDFGVARTLAATFSGAVELDQTAREGLTEDALTGTIAQDARYLSAWLSLEISSINPEWTLPHGRVRYTHYFQGPPTGDSVNLTGDVEGSLYHHLKMKKMEELNEPYLLSSTSADKDNRNNILGTSICVPVMKDGKFIGLTGMDITLAMFKFITDIKPFPDAKTFLVSNGGTIIAHADSALIGHQLSRYLPEDTSHVYTNIKEGKSMFWTSSAVGGAKSLIAIAPIEIGNTGMPWAIGTVVPFSNITTETNSMLYQTVGWSIVGLILLIITVLYLANLLTNPINQVKGRLEDLSKGKINSKPLSLSMSNDEVSDMVTSVNNLERNLSQKVNFAVEIGSGNLDASAGEIDENDTLGHALTAMRDNLSLVREQDKIRNWTSDGLSKLNEVLRVTSGKTDNYYLNALRSLLQYLGANQGGIFLVEENEQHVKHIELVAAYAYERKKFITKRLEWGEGLIGQCILEGETIHLKEIPEGYVTITSGLGGATPRVLILVPLKTETEVLGVMELASFKEFQTHEVEFIQKVSEIMAASIYAFRSSERTQKLLEKSQANEIKMREAEEEMRQNMEELTATQEAISRQESESKDMYKTAVAILNELPQKVFLKDQDGKMVMANDRVAQAHHLPLDQLIGKSDFDFVDAKTAQEWRNQELEIISKGRESYVSDETLDGQTRTLHTVKMAFYIPHLKQTGLLGIQTDLSDIERLAKGK